MNGKLASLLTVLASVFTLIAAALVLLGTPLAILFTLVSGAAVALWLWSGDIDEAQNRNLVSVYLAVPPLFMVLDFARYFGGWVPLLQTHFAGWFDPAFVFDSMHWFTILVSFPVSMILLGGHFLTRNQHVGRFMAWWTALYAITEGLIQFATGFANGADVWALVGALAAVALIGAGILLLQRLLAPKAAQVVIPAPLTDTQRKLWGVLFVTGVLIYATTLFLQASWQPVGIIVGSMMGGMIGWMRTSSRHPVDPSWAVPLFLLLVAIFYIHVGEEMLTDFNASFSIMTGTEWDLDEFYGLICLGGPIIWFFAAWSLWKRQPLGNFIMWFLIVGMILGEPTHLLVFPVALMYIQDIGYEYVGGMYTALFPMIPAGLLLARIVKEHRERKALA